MIRIFQMLSKWLCSVICWIHLPPPNDRLHLHHCHCMNFEWDFSAASPHPLRMIFSKAQPIILTCFHSALPPVYLSIGLCCLRRSNLKMEFNSIQKINNHWTWQQFGKASFFGPKLKNKLFSIILPEENVKKLRNSQLTPNEKISTTL